MGTRESNCDDHNMGKVVADTQLEGCTRTEATLEQGAVAAQTSAEEGLGRSTAGKARRKVATIMARKTYRCERAMEVE